MSKTGEEFTGIDQASSIGKSSSLREAELAAGAQSGQETAGTQSFQSIYQQEMKTSNIDKSMQSMDPAQEISAGEVQPGSTIDLASTQTIKEQLKESYAEMMEIRQAILSAYDRLQKEML